MMNLDPHISIAALVAEQARRRPRATAVVDRLHRLSYGQLERQANRLVNHLRTKPIEPGNVFGIALEPSCDLAVALLAVWKAGAIAVPMDPGFPIARLVRMIDDAGCLHLITNSVHAETFRSKAACVVHLDAEQP